MSKRNYQQVYELLEQNPGGLTSRELAGMLGASSSRVDSWLNNMAVYGYMTYLEGERNFALRRGEPQIGRGKPVKRDKRQVNGEPIRFGKWI